MCIVSWLFFETRKSGTPVGKKIILLKYNRTLGGSGCILCTFFRTEFCVLYVTIMAILNDGSPICGIYCGLRFRL